jgi:hypothetical protein
MFAISIDAVVKDARMRVRMGSCQINLISLFPRDLKSITTSISIGWLRSVHRISIVFVSVSALLPGHEQMKGVYCEFCPQFEGRHGWVTCYLRSTEAVTEVTKHHNAKDSVHAGQSAIIGDQLRQKLREAGKRGASIVHLRAH